MPVFHHTLPPGLQDDGGCHNKLSDHICNTNTPAGPSFLVDGCMTTLFGVDGREDSVTIAFAFSAENPPSIARVKVFLLTCILGLHQTLQCLPHLSKSRTLYYKHPTQDCTPVP